MVHVLCVETAWSQMLSEQLVSRVPEQTLELTACA
jgi:hypothetical protein